MRELRPFARTAGPREIREIDEPEALHPGEDEHRTTASVHYNGGRGLSAMAALGAKDSSRGIRSPPGAARPIGTSAGITVSAGREREERRVLPRPPPPAARPGISRDQFQAGYAYRPPLGRANLALGGTIAAFARPVVLDAYYGNSPIGYTLFARFSLGD